LALAFLRPAFVEHEPMNRRCRLLVTLNTPSASCACRRTWPRLVGQSADLFRQAVRQLE
jgi:hypothetical protein